MSSPSKSKTVQSVEPAGLAPFLPPWFLIPVILGLGVLLHKQLGTDPVSAAVSASFITLAAVVLTALTWHYAHARGRLIQGHSTVTVVAMAFLLLTMLIFGHTRLTMWIGIGVGALLALSWNIRRLSVIRGEGNDEHAADLFGLSVKSRKVLEKSKDREVERWSMSKGQTIKDVQGALPKLGSELSTINNGMRAVRGAREGEVVVTAVYRDVLTENIPWMGPQYPGGSVSQGFRLGLYEDASPIEIHPVGDYKKNVAPGHCGICGMSRSGKGVCTHVLLAELSTRRDAARIVLSDTRKGGQFTKDIEAMIGWYVDTDRDVRRMLQAQLRAVKDRNIALGAAGYSSWTPAAYDDKRLRMPALFVFIEEAAAVLQDNASEIVNLAEASLSAGVFFVFSAQLWKHDRVPTSLRSQVSNVIVFGCTETADASYLLNDSTLASGIDPGEWKTQFPGRALVQGNGVDQAKHSMPGKMFFAPGEMLKQVTDHWGPSMAEYDPVTLAAWGDAYTPYVAGAYNITTLGKTNAGVAPVTSGYDTEHDYDDDKPLPEEEDGMYKMPDTMDDAELDAMAAQIDPRQEAPAWSGPDVDERPDDVPGARVWDAEEKRTEFGHMLTELAANGPVELTTGELWEAWTQRLGSEAEGLKAYRMYELIAPLAESQDIERLARGRYRIMGRSPVARSA